MEWIPAMEWICLLASCLATASLALPQRLRLLNCVFRQRADITCRWEPGDTRPSNAMRYTLQIEKMRRWFHSILPNRRYNSLTVIERFNCSTSHNNCSVRINNSSVAFVFCVNITAHTADGVADSVGRCQSGRDEVMLSPVYLLSAERISGKPHCLTLSWSRALSYVVSDEEIREGKLFSQIDYISQYQRLPQVTNVKVRECNITACYFTACHFAPDTLYNIRLRHHFKSQASPWSHWSNPCQGRTAEDAPSAAPAFWRRVKQTDRRGWRNVTLLWKPLPRSLANGRVLSYNVTCRRKSEQLLEDHGSCRILHRTRTSCSLPLPPVSCSCSLTASSSAGSSPEAHIWLLDLNETEPPPPDQVTVNPLDDYRLDVRWTAPLDRSLSGFVVEWHAITERQNSTQHWARLNGSHRSLVITEGVEPMVRYAVSVKVVYGERGAGRNRTVHNYTRQGAPSAGPKVEVQEISDNRVELQWSLIPVEQRRGYIRNYTLHYTHTEGHSRSVCVPSKDQQYSLGELLPGDYHIYIQVNTDTGAGVAGPTAIVTIGTEHIIVTFIVKCTILPVILTSLALMLLVCLAQNKTVKQKLCQDIPDPSHSSLAHWTPNAFWEKVKILPVAEKPKIHKVAGLLLAGEIELQNSQTNNADAHSSTRTPEEESFGEPLTTQSETTTPGTEQYSCNSLSSAYSTVLFSQPPRGSPQSLLTTQMATEWPYTPAGANGGESQLGGESELPVYQWGEVSEDLLYVKQTKWKTSPFLWQRREAPYRSHHFSPPFRAAIPTQSPLSTRPLSVIPQPTAAGQPSESKPGDFYPFPCPISHPSNSFSTSLCPPHPLLFDPSSFPLRSNVFHEDCDPYIMH